MIANENVMAEHISCDCKCRFNSTIYNSNQKWNNKTCQCECKNHRTSKTDYSWNPSTSICENSKDLRSTSVTECKKIIAVTKKTIATNVTSSP